jgi:hypothetical protein
MVDLMMILLTLSVLLFVATGREVRLIAASMAMVLVFLLEDSTDAKLQSVLVMFAFWLFSYGWPFRLHSNNWGAKLIELFSLLIAGGIIIWLFDGPKEFINYSTQNYFIGLGLVGMCLSVYTILAAPSEYEMERGILTVHAQLVVIFCLCQTDSNQIGVFLSYGYLGLLVILFGYGRESSLWTRRLYKYALGAFPGTLGFPLYLITAKSLLDYSLLYSSIVMIGLFAIWAGLLLSWRRDTKASQTTKGHPFTIFVTVTIGIVVVSLGFLVPKEYDRMKNLDKIVLTKDQASG